MRRVYNETHHPIDQAVLSAISAIHDIHENPDKTEQNAKINGDEYPAYRHAARAYKTRQPGLFQLDHDSTMDASEREEYAKIFDTIYPYPLGPNTIATIVCMYHEQAAAMQAANPDMPADDISIAVLRNNDRIPAAVSRLADHWISVFQFGPNDWEA